VYQALSFFVRYPKTNLSCQIEYLGLLPFVSLTKKTMWAQHSISAPPAEIAQAVAAAACHIYRQQCRTAFVLSWQVAHRHGLEKLEQARQAAQRVAGAVCAA
jgi:hypothetical protein